MNGFVGLVVAGLLLMPLSGVAQAQKVGYLDLNKVFDNYEKTKEYDKTLEQDHAVYQKELNDQVAKIEELRGKLAVMKEEEKAKQQEAINQLTTKAREYDQEKRTELMKKRDEKIREILLEVEEVVAAFAKKEGYDFILNDRVLIYGKETMDITDPILSTLNSNYKK